MMTLPSQQGRTFLVTGANTGIGLETARALSRLGGRVLVGARSLEKAQPVVEELRAAGGKADPFIVDLGSFASIRKAAQEFLANGERLDVLVNNAGLASQTGHTQDGYEKTFGTNHLGPFLLTNLLLERLLQSPAPRVVTVASLMHKDANGVDFNRVKEPTTLANSIGHYAVSKLCNVLFAKELARRHPGLLAFSLHPGVIASDIWRTLPWPIRRVAFLFMKDTVQGARTSVWLATSPEVTGLSGSYFDDLKQERLGRVASDDALAKTLWERSAAMVGLDQPGVTASV